MKGKGQRKKKGLLLENLKKEQKVIKGGVREIGVWTAGKKEETHKRRREDSAVAKATEQNNLAELTSKWLLIKKKSCAEFSWQLEQDRK